MAASGHCNGGPDSSGTSVMTKLLKILVAVLLVLAVGFFLVAYLLPDRVRIERQISIDRPAGQVFAVVNDLRRFNDWSPWFDLDPEATYRHEGAEHGAGAKLHWSGNEQAGSGTLSIIGSEAPRRVATEINFEGFPVPAQAELLIEPEGVSSSRVTWTFDTALQGPLARWFGLLMPRYIGADYEKGLARLKSVVEDQPAIDIAGLDVADTVSAAFDVIVVAGEAPLDDPAESSRILGELYGRLLAFAADQNLEIVGQPMTFTPALDVTPWQFQAALPVRASGAVHERDGVSMQRVPAGRALVLEHVGPYTGLMSAMTQLEAYAVAKGLRRAGPLRSVYVSDPGDTPEEALLTRLVYPVAD